VRPPDARVVGRTFGLGDPAGPIRPLPGLSSAGVWALDTVDGAWVVKAQRPAGDWVLRTMRRAGQLETAAHAAGVAMPRPVPPPGSEAVGPWTPLPGDGRYVRVSERVSGSPPTVPADQPLAAWLGQTVAAIARLGQSVAVTEAGAYDVHALTDWDRWLGAAEAADLLDAAGRRALAVAVTAATAVMSAARAQAPAFGLAHRDISVANVLVTAHGPLLLDFDHAGPEVAWWELVHHTFLFACRRLGADPPVPAAVRTAVAAYASAGGEVGPADPTAFAGLLRGMLEWTALSLWLALGHRLPVGPPPGPGRREAAAAHVREAGRVLPIIVDSLDEWSRLLG
jgi:Ser/Thr protein kinase RdoA (MazF antagonist)